MKKFNFLTNKNLNLNIRKPNKQKNYKSLNIIIKMKKDLHTSAINSSVQESFHQDQRENCNIKKSTFHSNSSKNIKPSNNTHYKPIFGKENRDKNQILLNISNVIPVNNNTECSFLTCIDNDTKSEIKSMMTVLKNEILEMYSSMVSEIRKDFSKKCEYKI